MGIAPNRFFGLHAHTAVGSPFDGLGKPEDHFDFVLENNGQGMAITEHGNMNSFAGAFLYFDQLRKAGRDFKFVPGVEAYWHPDLDQWADDMAKAKEERAKKKKVGEAIEDEGSTTTVEDETATKSGRKFNPLRRRHHLVVLPKSERGLKSLFELVSYSYVNGRYIYPRIDTKRLKHIGRDLVVSTACIGGPFARIVFDNQSEPDFEKWGPNDENHDIIMADMENLLDEFVDAVGEENFFLELQFNKLGAQHLVNKYLIELAEKTGVKLIATADSHYPRPELWQAREMYKRLGWLGRKDGNDLPQTLDDIKCELYPKNADQMWAAYQVYKDYDFYDDQTVCDAIERSHDVAFDLIGKPEPDRTVKLPSYTVPKGEKPMQALIRMAKEGLVKRGLHKKEGYVERLKHELQVIRDKDFAEYFLAKKAIIDVAKKHMLVGFGRGSAASSLVCYCLGITGIDPIKYGLLFSRFLSASRKGLPDIDSDFSDRDYLLRLLREEFGSDNVIAISNLNTFRLKSLVKDIARYYDVPFEETNAATRWLEREIIAGAKEDGIDRHEAKIDFDNAMKYSESFKTFIDAHPDIKTFVVQLDKQTRSMGRHAGGVVVSEDILSQMPVIVSRGTMQTPWVEAQIVKQLEPFGWVKFDLLGLDTLRIIERCIELILQRHEDIEEPTFDDVYKWYSQHLDPDVIDLDDQKVYEHVYHDGNFAGVFQCTNRKTQKFFRSAKPRSIIDIAALTSIYRPGPLAADVDKLYVGSKENPETMLEQHELITKVLDETFGHLVFQEQAMALGNVVGGMPLDECDTLRKIVSKKPKPGDAMYEKALELEGKFLEGSVTNGVDKEEAEALYEKMMEFAKYSFNKSHAVSYGINSYLCAWLLTYYEQEWLCAYMESQSQDPDDKANALLEVKSFKYEVVHLDINLATENWTILPDRKFMPSISTCKGVGMAAIEEIKAQRPYQNIYDLLWNEDGTWKHSKANKKVIGNLIKIGAFDSLDCVGEDKLFANYKQMHDVLIENWTLLRKCLKKDNFITQMEKLNDLIESGPLIPTDEKDEKGKIIKVPRGAYPDEDWSTKDKINTYRELMGEVNLSLIVPNWLIEKMDQRAIPPIDQFPEDRDKKAVWFVVTGKDVRQTKSGKDYLSIGTIGVTGKRIRIFLWGWENHDIEIFKPYGAIVDKTDWGFSCHIRDVRKLDV